LPLPLIDLVERMMEKMPEHRPATAFDVETALIPFCRPGAAPPPPMPQVVSMALTDGVYPEAEAVPEEAIEEDSSDGWGVDAAPFAVATAAAAPRRSEGTASDRTRTRLLFVLGGLLHLTGIAIVIAWALGAFDSVRVETPDTPSQKQDDPGKVPKKVRTLPTRE
jgi:hypothetical protein